MKEIYNVEHIVKRALIDYPDTRNSDALLYVTVCKQINPAFSRMSMERALLERKELGLPKLASVGRARRKLQAKDTSLAATVSVKDRRYDNWKVVREYVQE